jgi:hypothetical protein
MARDTTTYIGKLSLDSSATHLRGAIQTSLPPLTETTRTLGIPLEDSNRASHIVADSSSPPLGPMSLSSLSLVSIGAYLKSGYNEPELGDSSLDDVLDTIILAYREVLSPIPLPTYLRKSVLRPPGETSEASGYSESTGIDLGKDFT